MENEIVEVDGKKILITNNPVEQEVVIQDNDPLALVEAMVAACENNKTLSPYLPVPHWSINRSWTNRKFRSPKRSQAKKRKHARQCQS